MATPLRYITIDQLRYWAGPSSAGWRTVETGDRTHRSISIAPLEIVLLTLQGGYDETSVTPYQHQDDAVAAAERIMAEPDPRGIYQQWLPDDGRPYSRLIPGGSFGAPRTDPGSSGRDRGA